MKVNNNAVRISVIVLNWNGKEHLGECFSALARQTLQDYEVIMVDNGSSDDSIEYVKEHYPDVIILALPKNLGFSAGNNCGIRIAKGKYIALLNNDAMPDADWLKTLWETLEKRMDIGFCASKIVFANQPVIDSAGDLYAKVGFAHKTGHLESAVDKYNEERMVFGACAAASIYRRSMLDDIGLLDETYFHSYEDIDLSFRAQLMGYSCLYVPRAIVRHKVSASSKAGSDFYVFYGQRNIERAYFINMPTRLLIGSLFLHLLYTLAAFIYYGFKGKGRAFIKAKISIVRSWQEIMERRRTVQGQRRISDRQLESKLEKKVMTMKIRNYLNQKLRAMD